MTNTAEQFIATSQANVQAVEGLTIHALAGLEKLVELNLAAGKTAVADTFSYMRGVLGVKDAQQLLTLQAGLFQPLAMTRVSYGSHVYNIAAETGAEIIKTFAALVDNAEKNVPPGTEPAVAILKSAVSASQTAIETAQATARKAMELAESSLTTVSNGAVNTSANASKKR